MFLDVEPVIVMPENVLSPEIVSVELVLRHVSSAYVLPPPTNVRFDPLPVGMSMVCPFTVNVALVAVYDHVNPPLTLTVESNL